ncbi:MULTISPECIES: hypothetical protein [unclassified Frankia]|uniref:hypothetical protein n=1 Tax=unclassified Frankia TaxID=2632575 RepID=UPI002AD543F5|nr:MULTISPECIES: hypothetical protein [unclassified Frankia]
MSGTDQLPDRFGQTRTSLHTLAEHVLAASRYRATGRIGLVVRPGGFGTPPFGPDHRTVSVEGCELVVRANGEIGRTDITTLRSAGQAAGIEPGAPSAVYTPATSLDLDAPLVVDPTAAQLIADWYALADEALRRFTAEIDPDAPSPITLWPEHLDVALAASGVNYGASPGDDYVNDPYLYVGPPSLPTTPPDPDGFWNQPFGASLSWEKAHSVDQAVEFFRAGHQRLPR